MLRASEVPARSFDIPAGVADKTLRSFLDQADTQFIYPAWKVRGIRTAAISGRFTPREALERMLAGSKLVVIWDPETGALAVDRAGRRKLPPRTEASPGVRPARSEDIPVYGPIDMDEFVVTGVFEGVSKQDATVAISTVGASLLETTVPNSAADLVRNVPGGFVNSSLGEIRNIVFSRGVSANATEGSSGYAYVSMQEDGLPVTAVQFVNYGPDYFLRADRTVERIEAVRGGSAAIAGANAPGGIFNYISKTGSAVSSGELAVMQGLEGDGNNPYSRVDLNVGGPLGKNFYYNVGGFYRRSDGARFPGYPLNRGGQIKANVTREFENGVMTIFTKHLDDHNGWFEFLPAVNFDNPQVAPGFSTRDSVLPPDVRFEYPSGPNRSQTHNFEKLAHSQSDMLGVKFQGDIGETWSVGNHAKYSVNTSEWNSGGFNFPSPLDDALTYALLGVPVEVTAGTYTFTDRATGQSVTVEQAGASRYTVTGGTLPGPQELFDTPHGFIQVALRLDHRVEEFMDEFIVTKRLDDMSFTGGFFFDHSRWNRAQGIQGMGVGTLTDQPRLLDIELQLPGGTIQQVTNAQGFGPPIGIGGEFSRGRWLQMAPFFGHRWDISDQWALDWGVRHERLDVDSHNQITGTVTAPRIGGGGLDEDPNTLYDNQYLAYGPLVDVDRRVDTTSYSGALSYRMDENHSVYVRYSNGKKAPDIRAFYGLDDPATNAINRTSPETVEQVELGYKMRSPGFALIVTPFYSELSDVLVAELLRDERENFYTRNSFNSIRTYGVELESEVYLEHGWTVRAAVTWQRAKANRWGNWTAGPSGARDDDVFVDLSGGRADSNPDVMATITPTYRKGPFLAQAAWRYMGSRPANAANVFELPAFDTTDVTLQWEFSRQVTLTATVNNLFDDNGVMTWAPPGRFTDPLDRQAFTEISDPNAVFNIIPIQPRAFFLTISYKF
ncbi:MAG TPA: TonB-dependent receptor [Opitutaceae bacterium]